jgi:uncharacterized protein YcbX
MSAYISQLAIYPLKSAAAIAVSHSVLSDFGLQWDRRWLLVDDQGKFITQRQYAQMALIHVQVMDKVLHLDAPNMLPLMVTPHHPQEVTVTVWQDTVIALTVNQEADTWLSQFLGFSVRLVFFPDYSQRIVDTAWAGTGHQTAFSDGFPLLVISQASLDDLSQRWGHAIDWRRFRPNIVIAGDFAPYSEDTWTGLKIGDVELALVKPCSRCVIPSINPQTGAKDSSLNRVLAQHRRRQDGKIYLGQNTIIQKAALNSVLNIGDKVQIISQS